MPMNKPPVEELTKGGLNRYALVMATAKCARYVADEAQKKQELSEFYTTKDGEKIAKFRDMPENAVACAIERMQNGEFYIDEKTLTK